MDRPLVALVLAGGTGTRLYPASRSDRPKQFLPLGGDRSLLAETVAGADFADETYVLTRNSFRPTGSGVPTMGGHRIFTIAWRALRMRPTASASRSATVFSLCLPSDHRISGPFETVAGRPRGSPRTPRRSSPSVSNRTGRRPATATSSPDRPRTARAGRRVPRETGPETATEYVREGFYWNAGLFAWAPTALLPPRVLAACTHGRATRRRGPRRRLCRC